MEMTRKVEKMFSKATAIVLVMALMLPYIIATASGITAEHQIDMYGIIAAYEDAAPFERVDYAELRLQRLLARKDTGELDSFTAQERHIVMEYLGIVDEREPIVREAEELLSHDWWAREIERFETLKGETVRYSELSEDERLLVFRQLDIAHDAVGIVNELFAVMERDGFTFTESVELIRIISSGMFDYVEARQLFQGSPSSLASIEVLERFEQFAMWFNIADEVNARRLTNRSFRAVNTFDEQSVVARHSGVAELGLSDYLFANRVEEAYSFVEAMQSAARGVEFGLDAAVEARHWANLESKTDDDWASLEPIFTAFTSSCAFNEARLMLLSGHCVREIEIAFALGAALQIEPQPLSDVVNNIIVGSYDVDIGDLGDIITYGHEIMSFGMSPMSDTVTDHTEIIENPFNLRFNMNESVNLNSGASMFRTNVLNIPGRNGLGLNLDLIYNSASADLRRPTVTRNGRWIRGEPTIYVYIESVRGYYKRDGEIDRYNRPMGVHGSQSDVVIVHVFNNSWERAAFFDTHPTGIIFQERIWDWPFYGIGYRVRYRYMERYIAFPNYTRVFDNITAPRLNDSVGVGWSFDLPFTKHTHASGSYYTSLYVPNRGSYSFHFATNVLRAYPLRDVRVEWHNGFVSGGLTSNRRVIFNDGTRYYFAERLFIGIDTISIGLVIGKVDRFGNTIRFEYAHQEAFGNEFLLSKIIDTNDNEINFEYSTYGVNRIITVTAPDESALGGRSTYAINMSPIPRPEGLTVNLEPCMRYPWNPPIVPEPEYVGFRVNSVRNQVGAYTRFIYEIVESPFCFGLMYSQLSMNYTLLLRQVEYPSGAVLHYSYIPDGSRLGNGSRRLWKVSARWLEYGYSGRQYQKTTFAYEGDHAWFSIHVRNTYRTTVTNSDTGISTVYTFIGTTRAGGPHLNTLQRTYDTNVSPHVLLSEKVIHYKGIARLPTMKRLTEHRKLNGVVRTRETIQRFEYNEYGQLIRALSPLAQGDWGLEEHITEFAYDDRFGLLLSRTSRPDAQTTVVERNVLCVSRRNLVRSYVYENGVLMSRTEFVYDGLGNLHVKRQFPDVQNNAVSTVTRFIHYRDVMPRSIDSWGIRDALGELAWGNGIVEQRFEYDSMWRVVRATDAEGYTTEWEYDAIGRITRIDFPNGGFVTYVYDDQANKVTHRTILGAVYVYRYDGFGNLRTVTAQCGTVILTNEYDTQMRLISTRNARWVASSQWVRYTYDKFGRVTATEHLCPAKTVLHRETVQYFDINDNYGNARIVTTIYGDVHSPSIESFVVYDRFGRRISEGVTGGRIVNFEYDNSGRVIREQSLGVDNRFSYNVFGMTAVTNIEGNTSRTRYDALGRVVATSDFMGNYTQFVYDALGRLIEQRVPFERIGDVTYYAITRYAYDRNGNVTRTSTLISRPGEAELRWSQIDNIFRYGMLISTNAGGVNTTYTYDLAGNVLTKSVGGAVTRFVYNDRGQLASVTDAMWKYETFTYDLNGFVLTRTDRNGTRFEMSYDHMGRLVREEARKNGVVEGFRYYVYTRTGALRRESDGVHAVWNYYDAQGRLSVQADTHGVVRWYRYNEANNVTHRQVWRVRNQAIDWWASGNRAVFIDNSYSYDIAGRLHQMTASGVVDVTYTYNANGAVIHAAKRNGVVTEYLYNLAGLVTRAINRYGNTALSIFDNEYYLDGNIRQVTEFMGGETRVQTFTYDAARRLVVEQDELAGTIKVYWYDARGNRMRRVEVTRFDELGAERGHVEYEQSHNTELSVLRREMGVEITTIRSAYERNGDEMTKTTLTFNVYDAQGNRGQEVVQLSGFWVDTEFVEYEYDLNNQLMSRRLAEPGVGVTLSTYTYDANGNQLTRFVSVEQWGIFSSSPFPPLVIGLYLPGNAPEPPRAETVTELSTYNVWNQLIRVVSEDMVAEYTYRPDGLRLTKTVDGVLTTHVWDGMFIVLEMNASGQMVNRFLRGLTLLSSYFHGWYTFNARGDVVQLVGNSGGVLRTYRYTAFGVELNASEGDTNPFRFAAEYYDRETGRIYLRARFYDPRIGRVTQPDPFWNVGNMRDCAWSIIQAGNLFVYTMNNPVMFIDPSGLAFIIAWSASNSDINEFNRWLYRHGHSDTLMSGTDSWTASHWAEFDSRDAFSRAAQTRRNQLIAMGIPESEIHLHRVDSRYHLDELWGIWAQLPVVESFELFSHFVDVRGGSGDFWDNAARLNWGTVAREVTINGRLTTRMLAPVAIFHGCRTTRNNFAQKFANRQGVTTWGNDHNSSFSRNPDLRYCPRRHFINPHGTHLGVYLRTYRWGMRVSMSRFDPR